MGINSLTLSDEEIKNLKELISLKKLKKIPITNEYELLRIKDGEINLIIYKTGKIVFNENPDTIEILNFVMLRETDYDYILGSDETGKGEWYGPLVIVATALNPEEIIKLRLSGVKDSKTIKKTKIMELAIKIMKMDFPRQYMVLKPYSYNKLYKNLKNEKKSLNDLLAWAHSRVIHELLGKIEFVRTKVVIDQFDQQKTEYRLGNYDKKRIEIIQKTGAESETPVAAASIIAKYLFETEINNLDNEYGLNLRNSNPKDIKPETLPYVAKLHFKNVNEYYK
ncbi:MAG: ribonuclease HIII [Methanobacterium sp.]|nr:ribonuclease HIII [Methanobacterium sp.]